MKSLIVILLLIASHSENIALAQNSTKSYSTEICSDEAKRLAKVLIGQANIIHDPKILSQHKIETEAQKKQLIEMVSKSISEAADVNYKKWSEHEEKQQDPFWKRWSSFNKLIGGYVADKAIELWKSNQYLSEERYNRVLYQQCMEKWFGSFEVTFQRPQAPVESRSNSSAPSTTVIRQAPAPTLPMGQNLNRCQQDGGSLTCFNHPNDVRMPRQGMTPYQ